MTLSELIAHVGDANVKFQRLTDCLKSASTNKKGVTTVTFRTDAIHTNDLMFSGERAGHLGLIIWLPKDKLP